MPAKCRPLTMADHGDALALYRDLVGPKPVAAEPGFSRAEKHGMTLRRG